jgi:pimeloyl-ACP methyl ester carboxylesterase
MPYARRGSVELFFDMTGDANHPPVLLVAGLGQQLIGWDTDAVQDLADQGYFVVRFDNRDVGLSTKLSGEVDLMSVLAAAVMGRTPEVPYTLADMANDILSVMDHLAIERAHVVGVSMGGMIGQRLALDTPQRLASLTSIMSTTGSILVGQSTPEAAAFAFGEPATSRREVIDRTVDMLEVYWGPHHWDRERARKRAEAAFDRSFHPEGRNRQFAAMLADGDRTGSLAEVRAPTLVIHGEADPLIDVSGGRATADAIPDAKLVTFSTMGHDIPPALWPEIRDGMTAHFAGRSA